MFWFILVALIIIVVALLFYLFPLIEVCGNSMYPTFNDGEIVLGCRLIKHFKIGDVFIYRPPVGQKYVIKRLYAVSAVTGNLFFEGDNSEYSYDSRAYGYVMRKDVVARYVLTIHKKKGVNTN